MSAQTYELNIFSMKADLESSRAMLQRFALSGAYVAPPLDYDKPELSVSVTDTEAYAELVNPLHARTTREDVATLYQAASAPQARKSYARILGSSMLTPDEKWAVERRSHGILAKDVGSGALQYVELDENAYIALMKTCVRDEWGRAQHSSTQPKQNNAMTQGPKTSANTQQYAFTVKQAAQGINNPQTSQMERTAFVLAAFFGLSPFAIAQVIKSRYGVRHDAFVNTDLAIERVRQRSSALYQSR